MVESHGMKQFVKQPTRITERSESKIDLVISNVNLEASVLRSEKVSDHSTIKIEIDGLEDKDGECRTVRKIVNYSPEVLREKLSDLIRDGVMSQNVNLNEKAKILSEKIVGAIEQFVKEVKVTRRTANKWYDEELTQMRVRKDHAYALAVLVSSHSNWVKYRTARNKYLATIREKKRNYMEKKLNKSSGDAKQTWKILKALLNGKRKGEIGEIEILGTAVSDTVELANGMNEFYVRSVVEINRSIGNSELTDEVSTPRLTTFDFRHVEADYLKRCLSEMKNKSDTKLVSPKILLDAWPIIGEMVTEIANQSLDESVPDEWKITTVVPVPKNVRPKRAEEFRPVNMLPTLEKLIETVVKDQLMEYIEENDILSWYQSGYRMHHSCETALNLVMAKWKEIGEQGDIILAVFLDLKRAFETVDRKRLLAKLRKFGFSQRVVSWFAGYLNGRSQQTKVNGYISDRIPNDLGVPQGSVLGAILFVLYVNDMPQQLKKTFINLFADDTLIYLHGKNIDVMRNEMNEDLERLNQWLKLNKLKLNVSKTKVMVLGNASMKSPVNAIIMDGEVLGIEREFKYLGVMLDEKLSFKANVDYVCKKVAKKVGLLTRLARNLTINARISIYKSVIAPHFDYCASLLYLSNASSFDRMQKLQNRAMRAILRCRKLTPIREMLEALDLLSVKQRVTETTMKFIYKLKHGLLPRYLSKMVTYNCDIHEYPTRSRNDFRVGRRKDEKSWNSVFYKGLVQFNSLPGDVKNEKIERTFKKNLRQFVKDNV